MREFEFVHGVFELPQNIFLFRAANPTLPVAPSMPAFFGDYEVAKFYARQDGRVLKAFEPKKKIRVLDMRYVQAVLPQLWQLISPTPTDVKVMYKASLCLGLVSYQKQLEILEEQDAGVLQPMIRRMKEFMAVSPKPAWVNPLEMQGVRCGITDYDYQVMNLLKVLFGDVVDGIIAPALPSPFHSQIHNDIERSMLYQELVLFDPAACLKEVVTTTSTLATEGEIFAKDYVANLMRVATGETSITRRSVFMVGGKRKSGTNDEEVELRDAMGEKIGTGDVAAIKTMNTFMKAAKKLAAKIKRSQVYLQYYCPNICTIGSPIPGIVRID